jgi:hypothetical protein
MHSIKYEDDCDDDDHKNCQIYTARLDKCTTAALGKPALVLIRYHFTKTYRQLRQGSMYY